MGDPDTEAFASIAISRPSRVAQLGGRPGEVWGGERVVKVFSLPNVSIDLDALFE